MNLLRLITARKGVAGLDPAAQAFITAAGITDPTQQSAINQLVLDLKGYGLWTKMKAVYPFVGGTATTHKYNLINPVDTDAAFRLVFNGSWTHSATGAANNSNYANTFLVPSSTLIAGNNQHLSLYSRTSSGQVSLDMGSGATVAPSVNIYMQFVDNKTYSDVNIALVSIASNGLGLAITNSTPTAQQVYFNNTSASTSAASTGLAPYSIYIGASNYNNNNGSYPGNREYAFASIGDGLTNTEAANLYTSVQTFQTTLGRQV